MKATAKRRTGLPVEFAQAPMRTVRTADGAAVYAHPGTQMVRLQRLGLLHKVAVGYYVVVPQEHVGADWRPTIEAAAAGVATAALGAGRAVLMGVSAARLHNVVPRALGMAIVAAPGDRRDLVLRDRDGLVHFVQRDTDVLDAELMTTDLGPCLVTTPEQTVLDLEHRPNLGHVVDEARAAIVALLPRCNEETLERLAGQQRLRAALTRVRRTSPVTRPIGLQPDDLAQVMASFGVAEAQVRRDHAISHILAALSRHRRGELIFIGAPH